MTPRRDHEHGANRADNDRNHRATPADKHRPLDLPLKTLIQATRFMPPPRRHLKTGRPITGALGEGRQISRQRGAGDELDSIGPFQDGDDPRHIDWSASARTGRPQVRRFLARVHRPCMIFVDMRTSMFFGTEWCVPAMQACLQAAALSAFLQRRQEPFSIIGLGGTALMPINLQRLERVGRHARFRAQVLDHLQQHYQLALTRKEEHTPDLADLLDTVLTDLPFDYDAVVVSDFGQMSESVSSTLTRRRVHSVHALIVNDPVFDGHWRAGHYPGRLSHQASSQIFRVPRQTPQEQQQTLRRWRTDAMLRLADQGFGAIWEPAHQPADVTRP